MSEYELGSQEFFDHYYPKTKQNTRAGYIRLINSLNLWRHCNPTKQVGQWLDDPEFEDNPTKWKSAFLFLRKFNDIYWSFDLLAYNNKYLQIMRKAFEGENLTVNENYSDPKLLEIFNELDGKLSEIRKLPIHVSNLFGCWLPPRRWCAYKLLIRSSDTDELCNYYNKATNQFVFRDYKNKSSKGVQKLSILNLMCLYDNTDDLYKVIEWLNNQPDGPLCSSVSNLDKRIKRWYGVPNRIIRKYWTNKYKNSTKKQQIILAEFMDHSLDVARRNYTVDDPNVVSVQVEQPEVEVSEPINEISTQTDSTIVTKTVSLEEHMDLMRRYIVLLERQVLV